MKDRNIKKLYFFNVAKNCKNCFYYEKWPVRWFTLSRCNKYPTWLTEDALRVCQYQEWVPNEKLVAKYGTRSVDDTIRNN